MAAAEARALNAVLVVGDRPVAVGGWDGVGVVIMFEVRVGVEVGVGRKGGSQCPSNALRIHRKRMMNDELF